MNETKQSRAYHLAVTVTITVIIIMILFADHKNVRLHSIRPTFRARDALAKLQFAFDCRLDSFRFAKTQL